MTFREEVPEGDLPAPPRLRPLKSISPSRFLAAKECPLREAFAANRIAPALPHGPAARLGSVIHALLEAAGKGEFASQDASAIDADWNRRVAEAEVAMSASWLERHLVPLKESIPDFEVRRLQARQRALELAETAARSRAPETPHERGFGCELPVASPDGAVRGQIDAAVASERGTVIRDYKSGTIFDPTANGAAILKPSYETQLRFYAALYAMTFGKWPERLEIVPVLGEAQPVAFRTDDCLSLVDEARAFLGQLNDIVQSQSPETAQARLARPDAATCNRCAYRPLCTPYKDGLARLPEARDVIGTLSHLQELGNGTYLLELIVAGTPVRIRGLTRNDRHPALKELQVGDTLGVFNVRATGSETTFAESPYTAIYRLTPG